MVKLYSGGTFGWTFITCVFMYACMCVYIIKILYLLYLLLTMTLGIAINFFESYIFRHYIFVNILYNATQNNEY